MIKYFFQLFFVLLEGFGIWSVYEQRQWPINYGEFTAAKLSFAPADQTYENHINKEYFMNSTVITDKENLRFP